MSIGDLLRYLLITAIGVILAVMCLKWWSKHSTGKAIVAELRSLANPTSSFEQFYAEDANKTLYRTMAQLQLAEERLGKGPREMLDQVFHGKGEGALFPTDGTGDPRYVDPREDLIRTGLLRNYQNCKSLGIFDELDNLEKLAGGDTPLILKGRTKGRKAFLAHIISPEVSPGIEKIVPNLKISPPTTEAIRPTEFEIKAAKELAEALSNAELIERSARDRIINHYEQLGAGAADLQDRP